MEPEWRKTAQFAAVDYRRVEVANARITTLPSEWPDDIRWIVEAFRETEAGKGKAAWSSPRFYVANGRKLMVTAAGHAGWNDRIQPVLRKLTGT